MACFSQLDRRVATRSLFRGIRALTRAAVLTLLAVAAPAPPAAALQLPAGFVAESLPWSFDVPTKIAFLPDGRLLVAEKGGIVYVVAGNTRHALWVREDEVLNTDDRGLLAIAVDPDFAANRRLYFLYNVDPDSNGIELDNYDESFGRLVRYEMSATDSNAVDPLSRTILIGASWSDGIPSCSGAHNVGDLAWGRDGTLLVSAGDGAHFDDVDAGGLDPDQFLPGRTDPAQDLGAFRAQSPGSMAGKVLRVDPETGHGLPSNPFWDGNPTSPRSRVWAYGLRNPFRIEVRPGTGSLDPALGDPGQIVVGDVGWSDFEELNVVTAGGANFGWPCFEGFFALPDYQAADPDSCGCSTIGTPPNPSPASNPVVSVARFTPGLSVPPGPTGGTIVGGVFTAAPGYPAPYRDHYYFGDYTEGWIRALALGPDGTAPHLFTFAAEADGPVSFAADPLNGDLWFVSIWTGEVRRVRWTGTTSVLAESPAVAALSRALPNPSRAGVTLTLDLPRTSSIELRVYDASGRRVWGDGTRVAEAGRHRLFWPGHRDDGTPAAPGLYLVSVEAAGGTLTRRVAIVR